jgi:hypothetical protein
MTALQMLYPYFPSDMQSSFQRELQTAWAGLINSPLYDGKQFAWSAYEPTDTTDGYSNDASLLGAMLLFIDGIIPQTASLAITASNECYQDYQTCFPTSEWGFNFASQTIKIPVTGGNLEFIFGSQPVTATFPSSGVYTVQFTPDWNSIVSVTKISILNVTLLQNIGNVTLPAPTLTPSPPPTQPSATATPQTVNQNLSPTATAVPHNSTGQTRRNSPAWVQGLFATAASFAGVVTAVSIAAVFKKKRKTGLFCFSLNDVTFNKKLVVLS